jgi:hypothetical protein
MKIWATLEWDNYSSDPAENTFVQLFESRNDAVNYFLGLAMDKWSEYLVEEGREKAIELLHPSPTLLKLLEEEQDAKLEAALQFPKLIEEIVNFGAVNHALYEQDVIASTRKEGN